MCQKGCSAIGTSVFSSCRMKHNIFPAPDSLPSPLSWPLLILRNSSNSWRCIQEELSFRISILIYFPFPPFVVELALDLRNPDQWLTRISFSFPSLLASCETFRENNTNSPSTSHPSLQEPRQPQTRGSRSPSSSHPSVLNGGTNNVEDPAKRRRLVSSSNNKDSNHSSDPTVDFDKPPISPVVLGFNLSNTDPGVRDTVRSALRMKEQQQLIIQQRRGVEGSSSAASTPPQASAKVVPGGRDAVAGGGESSSSSKENGMDVEVKPAAAAAPDVEVQAASPALGSGGFSSGGLATRSHEEGRAKAGGLSILTPASKDAAKVGLRFAASLNLHEDQSF